MARRRSPNVFGLAFLDAMTCGLGAVVLLYMIINANVGVRANDLHEDLSAEVDRLEEEVLEGSRNLVRLRNTTEDIDDTSRITQGLSRRLLETLEAIREELATYENTTLARREHLNKLKTDLKTLEDKARRLSASQPSQETPGDRLRTFVGDGDRQYLTGLKIGGERILILVDTSASMLDATIVNIIRLRNLPEARKRKARKWRQVVATVDWLTTQLPRSSQFQVYTFADSAGPVVPGDTGAWRSAGNRKALDETVDALREAAPAGGTNLYAGLAAAAAMRPPPDNVILLVDGLPTRGAREPSRGKVSGKERLKHFDRALRAHPSRTPINVILFPMEGDPMAASAYWKLALATRGSFLAPSRDWP